MALVAPTLKTEGATVGMDLEQSVDPEVAVKLLSRSTSAGSLHSRDQSSTFSSPYPAHAVGLPESVLSSPYPAQALGLPEYDYPMGWSFDRSHNGLPSALITKNTFLGTKVQRSLSLEEFIEERLTQSCPASGLQIGLPPGLEDLVEPEEAAARLAAAESEIIRKAASAALSYQSPELQYAVPQQASAWDMQAPHAPVTLDLMQALSVPREASQPQFPESQFLAAALPPAVTGLAQPMEQVLGSVSCPTVGSQGHWSGACKPCAFLYTKGCGNGAQCSFCHLCEPGEKKRRAKEVRTAKRVLGARGRY